MKVLHISPTYYAASSVIGGGEKYILYMAKALSKASGDAENLILAFGEEKGEFMINGARCSVSLGRPWDPYSVDVEELQRHIAQADVVIVHQCLTAFGLFAASHARLAGKAVVGMDHGGGEHPIVGHTQEAGLMFHRFLTYSKFAMGTFGALNVPTKIIYGPVDTEYYHPSPSEEREKDLVVAVGRILPHKGFERIIKALPKSLRLVILGTASDPEYRSMLDDLVQSCQANVIIRGGLSDDEVRSLLRKAALFVHASTHFDYKGHYYAKPELLGLAPLEALACGTPTIVSNAGSLPELGSIVGCRVFGSEHELSGYLRAVAEGERTHAATDIYESVKRLYGIEQYGAKLAVELASVREAL
jgi:glycosyltransferase involved in cell wall biosynthesis